MTEITVQKKKKPVWPWILIGLGLIALLIYFFAFSDKKDELKETHAADMISIHENNSTVAAYVSFINSDTNKMSLDHSFASEALVKLTDATEAMAGEIGYSVKGDLDKAKEYANMITKDPSVTTHADNIRKAADILANVLQNIQQAKYPSLNNKAAEVKNASASINPETLTLDQRDVVKSFFHKAADLLEKMN